MEREAEGMPPATCIMHNLNRVPMYKMTFNKSASYYSNSYNIFIKVWFSMCLHHMTFLQLTCFIFYLGIPDDEYLTPLQHHIAQTRFPKNIGFSNNAECEVK